MKKVPPALFLSLLVILGGYHASATDYMSLPEGMSVTSVHALRISESPDMLKVLLTLGNENRQAIRIKKGRFRVLINPESRPCRKISGDRSVEKMLADLGGGKEILPDTGLDLGETNPIEDFEIGACVEFDKESGKCEKPGEALVRADIPLPGVASRKNRLICKLLNYMGLPGAEKKIALIGDTKIGIRQGGDWMYQKLRLELHYRPKLQSEDLFTGW